MDCTTCISRQTPRTIFPCSECIATGGRHPGKTYPHYHADYALLATKPDDNNNTYTQPEPYNTQSHEKNEN